MNERRLFRIEFVEQDEFKSFECQWRVDDVQMSVTVVMILIWEKIELDSSLFPVGFELGLFKDFSLDEIIK